MRHYDNFNAPLMGDLLAVLFIGTIFFVTGMILVFSTDQRGRKYGIYLVLIGVIVYLACWAFTPNTPQYNLFNDNKFQL